MLDGSELDFIVVMGHQTIHMARSLSVPHILVDGIVLMCPRVALIDRFTINLKPLSHLEHSLFKQRNDSAIVRWTKVDQNVSATTHSSNQCFDQFFSGFEITQM